MLGREDRELLGDAFADHVHPDDLATVRTASAHAEPAETVFRVRNRFGEWRHLETHVTDLRANRRIRHRDLQHRRVLYRTYINVVIKVNGAGPVGENQVALKTRFGIHKNLGLDRNAQFLQQRLEIAMLFLELQFDCAGIDLFLQTGR